MYNPRALVNRGGVTYDALKLSTTFKEDWDEIATAFGNLETLASFACSAYLVAPVVYGVGPFDTLVLYDTVHFDPSVSFNTATGQYTASRDMLVKVNALFHVTNAPAGTFNYGCALYLNGTKILSKLTQMVAPIRALDIDTTLQLVAGDVLEIHLVNNSVNTPISVTTAGTNVFNITPICVM
jgi:hypothetical protein